MSDFNEWQNDIADTDITDDSYQENEDSIQDDSEIVEENIEDESDVETNNDQLEDVEDDETEESPSKPEKKFAILKRYDELEEKVFEALEKDDIDTVLLLNELTLARNIEEHLSRWDMKQFKVIYVAFKSMSGVVKRAGIYNSIEIPNPEDAEDIMIAEDFTDNRVLCVPRNSIFAEHFTK